MNCPSGSIRSTGERALLLKFFPIRVFRVFRGLNFRFRVKP
jgi:hypothetical protein